MHNAIRSGALLYWCTVIPLHWCTGVWYTGAIPGVLHCETVHRTKIQYCADRHLQNCSVLLYCTDSRPRWHQKGFCIVLVHWCTGEMYCIGTSSIADSSEVASRGLTHPRRTRGVLGITTKYQDGEFKCSKISLCQPECLVQFNTMNGQCGGLSWASEKGRIHLCIGQV